MLIVRDGWVTDTSFTNVVFEDAGGGLYTPETCLLEGTRRQSLLDEGRIQACPDSGGGYSLFPEGVSCECNDRDRR